MTVFVRFFFFDLFSARKEMTLRVSFDDYRLPNERDEINAFIISTDGSL